MASPSLLERPWRLASALPPSLLAGCLWPAAAVRTAWELGRAKPTLPLFRRLPSSWWTGGVHGVTKLALRRTRMNVAKTILFWPDRLGEDPWRRRCSCDGLERFAEARAAGRGVVLATLHFGPQSALLSLLRARGVAAAALVDRDLSRRPAYRRRLDAGCDTRDHLVGMPRLFAVSDLADALEYLRAGHVLITSADGGLGTHLELSWEDHFVRLSPGPCRMAAMTGSLLVPGLIVAQPRLHVGIHVGPSVPQELVSDRRRHDEACRWLYQAWLPWLRTQPEQCSYELLYSIRRDPKRSGRLLPEPLRAHLGGA